MDHLVNLWGRYRRRRSRQQVEKASEQEKVQTNEPIIDSTALDEAKSAVIGMGLECSDRNKKAKEDPRFAKNPIGIGFSRNFEQTATATSVSSSPASADSSPCTSEDSEFSRLTNEEEQVWDAWTDSRSIDWVKGKRKGRVVREGFQDVKMTKASLVRLRSESDGAEHISSRKRFIAAVRERI